jgi:hypothetical protein
MVPDNPKTRFLFILFLQGRPFRPGGGGFCFPVIGIFTRRRGLNG